MKNLHKKIYAYLQTQKSEFNKKLELFKNKIFTNFEDKTILEIGAGSGNNLHYYKNAQAVFLAEPNIYNHPHIEKTAGKLKLNVKIIPDFAEKLHIKNDSVDVVVCNFVLCSVKNSEKVITEIIRVLKPGGRFIFIEHIASEKFITKNFQLLLRPIWKFISNGCDCHHHTDIILKNFINLMEFKYEIKYEVPGIFLKPYLIGTAWKK